MRLGRPRGGPSRDPVDAEHQIGAARTSRPCNRIRSPTARAPIRWFTSPGSCQHTLDLGRAGIDRADRLQEAIGYDFLAVTDVTPAAPFAHLVLGFLTQARVPQPAAPACWVDRRSAPASLRRPNTTTQGAAVSTQSFDDLSTARSRAGRTKTSSLWPVPRYPGWLCGTAKPAVPPARARKRTDRRWPKKLRDAMAED